MAIRELERLVLAQRAHCDHPYALAEVTTSALDRECVRSALRDAHHFCRGCKTRKTLWHAQRDAKRADQNECPHAADETAPPAARGDDQKREDAGGERRQDRAAALGQ